MRYTLVRTIGLCEGVNRGTLAFPSIGTGILAAHLRGLGYEVAQDDLHARWYAQADATAQARLAALSADVPRLWAHLAGPPDPEWLEFCAWACAAAELETCDTALISLISADSQCVVLSLALSHYLRTRLGKTTVVGGEYFAYSPILYEIERVLRAGALDYYVGGYGETPLARLLPVLEGRAGPETRAAIPGLHYLESAGALQANPFVAEHDLVLPDFDGLPLELYRWTPRSPPPRDELPQGELPRPEGELTLPYHTSTGCPYNCAFCECSLMRKVKFASGSEAAARMAETAGRAGAGTLFMLDNTFNFSKRFVVEFCEELIRQDRGLHWMNCASARNMDAQTLRLMRRAGAVRLVWGLESGSRRILEFINKPTDLDEVEAVLAAAHEAGIFNGIEIIVGLPTESEAEFAETLDFIDRNAAHIDEVWPNAFYLNSHSAMRVDGARYGIAETRDVNRSLMKDQVPGSFAATYTFDEADGLSWADKQRQLEDRMGRMVAFIAERGLYPMAWEHEQQPNLLSWCYRQAGDKAEAVALYRAYWERLALEPWQHRGFRAESLSGLAEELRRHYPPAVARALVRGDFTPTYAGLETGTSLMIDGRLHDARLLSLLEAAERRPVPPLTERPPAPAATSRESAH
ncbi:hypothetical protein AY600_13840 [Phormidium willei BDU 130791]|nr:hypothetical protein AY600_13840 [Phormidium willei BDU 130791]